MVDEGSVCYYSCLLESIHSFDNLHIHIATIPQEIIDKYNMLNIVDNQGYLYVNIVKGMYGLKKSGIISHRAVILHLAPFRYHPYHHTPGIWQHETRDTIFTLVVDEGFVCYDYRLLEFIHSFDNLHIDIALVVDYVQ